MIKVLLIEDDLVLQNLISEYLEEYSYSCSAFSNPLDALDSFKSNPDDFTIVILDLGLPHMDGFDVFKKLKKIKDIPIIISTARDDIGNKIYGFELGTDDYLSKPYEPRELVLRIEATLKRYNKSDSLKIKDLSIDKNNSRIFLSGMEIEFTKIEKEIFFLFINNLNKIISREDIVKKTSLNDDTKNRTIDMHISNIRYKIDDNSKEPKYIKSIWGIGYKFFYDN
ncbi:response regulator transcription factor [Poseidonibacter lekithochrous]|uniref:response regulator transcription factor n=1 Tax=Poseidonibacter TaxID=2321187 RepID=UPI001C08C804|nr:MULTISPECIES: response regulator transcription factor [Poseidonibacter]MBU3015987.1 response regulator transcription factor [Poseidonibacter lekithochrous]MDO6829286.1 response regulator transcription factor [Poseidonibacter sp. 1_MG-2023]